MDRIARFVTFAALGVATLAPAKKLPAQEAAPTVAVVTFNHFASPKDRRDFSGVGTALAALLGADLGAAGDVRVLDRAQVQHAVQGQPLSRRGMIDRGAAVEAAKQLGAQHVVYGGFSADESGHVRIDSRGVNTSTGAVEFTERVQGNADDVVALMRQLASRLVAGMGLPASTHPSTDGAASAVPLRSLVSFGKALDLAAQGDNAQAQSLLTGVIADNPGFAPAKAALAALKPR